MSDILYQISRRSGITIYFLEDDVSKYNGIDYFAKDQEVTTILSELFKNTDLNYNVLSPKYIGVKKVQLKTSSSFERSDTLSVKGVVTDDTGNFIPGATVILKGSQMGTITNDRGYFVLNNVPNNGVLTISSVSFTTRDVAVKGRNNIGVAELSRSIKPLDDIVILAYSKTTGRYLTGNVSKVKAKDIENSPVSNPILAISGRVPGITISQSSGFSGTGVDISIQGVNSLYKGVAPFFVVDGVPYTQSLLPNFGNVLRTSGRGTDGPVTGNPLSYINPQDIESIEILKDADATAIYGSRAANGAILITTKRGKVGNTKLAVNFQHGYGKVSRRLNLLSSSEYLQVRREAKLNDNNPIGATDYDLNGMWDTTRQTDWQKDLIGGRANYTDAQLSLSGGSESTQYMISGNVHKESTVMPTDLGDTKVSFRLNLDTRSRNEKFKLGFSASYLSDANRLPVGDVTEDAMNLPPVYPALLTANGDINWAPDSLGNTTMFQTNTLARLRYSNYYNKTYNLISNLNIQYQLAFGLHLKSSFGYSRLRTDELSTNPIRIAPPELRQYVSGSTDFGFNDIRSWIVEPQITYEKQLSITKINLLAGASIQQSDNDRKAIFASGFANDEVLENISAATNLRAGTSIISKYKYAAAFFSLNLITSDRYILNLTARRDGSSRFGSSNRYHTFGAAAVSWIFTNETALKDLMSFLSFGKLKASYGTTGNDQIGDYSYFSLYQNNNTDIPYRGGSALDINRLTNTRLQWEETRKISFGTDLGFLDDRIVFNGNYYRNRSSNMLAAGSIPATAGPINSLTVNIPAVIQNHGVELMLTTLNIKTANFRWNTSLNLTLNRNKVTSYGDLDNGPYAFNLGLGLPVGFVRALKYHGVNPVTGKYEFVDKEGKITYTPDSDPYNYYQFIDPTPKFYGGMSNTLSFKGIELDFLFSFIKQKGSILPSNVPPGYFTYNQQKNVLNRWQKEGDKGPVQRYFSSDFSYYSTYFNYINSDAVWHDASYIRLKNLSLAYNIPATFLRKANIQSCRIYMLAQNLLTFTSYDGLDPETRSNFSLPPLRVMTFGVQITL